MNPYDFYYQYAPQQPTHNPYEYNPYTEKQTDFDRQPQALERRVSALERQNERQVQELSRLNNVTREHTRELNRQNREITRLNEQVVRLNQTVEQHTRRLNRLNQRLRAVENRLSISFTPVEGGF